MRSSATVPFVRPKTDRGEGGRGKKKKEELSRELSKEYQNVACVLTSIPLAVQGAPACARQRVQIAPPVGIASALRGGSGEGGTRRPPRRRGRHARPVRNFKAGRLQASAPRAQRDPRGRESVPPVERPRSTWERQQA